MNDPDRAPRDPTTLTPLVMRARRGEVEAIDELASRACTIALRTASVVAGGDGLARDIAQDVAVDALRGLKSLKEPDAFDAWVHAIAVRRTRRALRRRAVFHRAETSIEELGNHAAEGDEVGNVALRNALSAAIATLPIKQRLAIALRYVHDLSDSDIAEALGCKEGTVHSYLSRARAALRRSPELTEFGLEQGEQNHDRHRNDAPPRIGCNPLS